jgi:uncharacterized membrane protein
MRFLLTYFVRGLLVLTPLAVTVAVVWWVLRTIDGWLGIPIPGAGIAATLALIVFVGFLASTVITRSILRTVDQLLNRLPFVRLLYNSTRDLMGAFVGTQRRFDRPVVVTLEPHVRVFGFVTGGASSFVGAEGLVAVFCPQSYNFAGQLLVVPEDRVSPLTSPAADVLAFVMSGGVTGVPAGPPLGTEGALANHQPSG